jgi:hypothetical protein
VIDEVQGKKASLVDGFMNELSYIVSKLRAAAMPLPAKQLRRLERDVLCHEKNRGFTIPKNRPRSPAKVERGRD